MRYKFSWMFGSGDWLILINISKDRGAFIFRVKQSQKSYLLLLDPEDDALRFFGISIPFYQSTLPNIQADLSL